MQSIKSEQTMHDALSRLPREVQPRRDLWKGIELGLEQPIDFDKVEPKPYSGRIWYATAASFALIAMVGWFGLQSLPSQPGFAQEGSALVQALSAQHQDHMNTLLVKFEGRSAVTENWQEQLQELDDAAKAIKLALAEDPANTALLRMLQNTYQQQIDLIERVHAPRWQQI